MAGLESKTRLDRGQRHTGRDEAEATRAKTVVGKRMGFIGDLGFGVTVRHCHSAGMASAALLTVKNNVMSRIPLIIAQIPAKTSSAAACVSRN